MLQFLESDDLTPVSDLAITAYEAGQDSDPLAIHLWHSQGAPGPQPAEDVLVVLRTEDPASPGRYLAQGVPPQDEMWGRVRITGHDNRGDPSWVPQLTGWQALGAFGGLLVPAIPQDCAVHLEVLFHPPGTAAGGPWRHQLLAIDAEHSQAAPPWGDRGILTAVGDRGRSALVSGLEVSASAPADDLVTVAAGRWIHQGIPYGKVEETVSLDQSDGDATALAAGEAYWAVLSLGAGLTVTKGSKAANPTRPSAPEGEIPLAWVQVDHGGGGSQVEAADIDASAAVYDRFLLLPDLGLDATVHAGQAIGDGTWRYRSTPTPITFPPTALSRVWLRANGNLEIAADPPEPAALELWEVETDASAITAITDRRTYAGRERVIALRDVLPVGIGQLGQTLVVDPLLYIESVWLRASDNGGGTAGQTLVDVLVDGASIFPSSATSEERPAIPWDSSALAVASGPPEVLELRAGQVVTATVEELPTGGTPSELELVILARVPA